jgi:hypothetical protein
LIDDKTFRGDVSSVVCVWSERSVV